MVSAVEPRVVKELDHNPSAAPELFRGTLDEITQLLTSPEELGSQLDSLLGVARANSDWEAWRYPGETRTTRLFTPWFGESSVVHGLRRVTVQSRLHLRLPNDWHSGGIVHTERKITNRLGGQDGVYVGFEVTWNPSTPMSKWQASKFPPDSRPTVAINDPERGGRIHLGPYDEDPTYWKVAAAIIGQAHSEFVG